MLKPLRGWEEIRTALLFVEGLFTFSKHTLAGVEVYQQSEDSTTRVFLRTVDELDSYLAPIFERMHLDLELGFNQYSNELDVLSEVCGRIVLDYPHEVNRSHEMMP
jgi:hypothetical protein